MVWKPVFFSFKRSQHTLQQVGQSLGPEDDWPLGLVVGDGELLHPQLLRDFGLRAVVDQRTAKKLHANTEREGGGLRLRKHTRKRPNKTPEWNNSSKNRAGNVSGVLHAAALNIASRLGARRRVRTSEVHSRL